MDITLTKPELKQFVDEQVRAGHFSSPTDVIEAALARLMLDRVPEELDDATLAAIEEGNAQIERGEGIDFSQFAAEMRKRYAGK